MSLMELDGEANKLLPILLPQILNSYPASESTSRVERRELRTWAKRREIWSQLLLEKGRKESEDPSVREERKERREHFISSSFNEHAKLIKLCMLKLILITRHSHNYMQNYTYVHTYVHTYINTYILYTQIETHTYMFIHTHLSLIHI